MTKKVKIFQINNKEVISFNQEGKLIFIVEKHKYYINYKAILLGVIDNKLIVFIKNKYIVSLLFPSFTIHIIVSESFQDIYACAHSSSAIWFQQKNKIFCIDSNLQISLYDEFSEVSLLNLVYLEELEILAVVLKNNNELKICFYNSALPNLIFPETDSIPEIFFDSKHGILFFIGRSLFKYDISEKNLHIINETKSIHVKWKNFDISIEYNVIKTDIIVSDNKIRSVYKIESDVWRIINLGEAIYFLSDSINAPIIIHKIDSNGVLLKVFNELIYNFTFNLDHTLAKAPLLKVYSNELKEHPNSPAILFVHGGPHQKAGNLWDSFLSAFLKKYYYCVYVPQYRGTLGLESNSVHNYGLDDFEDLLFHFDKIKQIHSKIILVGHSYGAFLALKLFLHRTIDILVGINGVYDLLTIADLNPKTYAHLDEKTKVELSPKFISQKKGEWHHIHFKYDPLIRPVDLERSLNRIGTERPKIHYLNFRGHGSFTGSQSSQIVELIKLIEHQSYKKLLIGKVHEQVHS